MMIRANTLSRILIAIFYCVSALTDVCNAQFCPSGGTLLGPTLTVNNADCPEIESNTWNLPAFIRWVGGGITEVALNVTLISGQSGNLYVYSKGVAVNGLFAGRKVDIQNIPLIDGQLVNCAEEPVSEISGRAVLRIDATYPYFLECDGTGGVSFDPAITSPDNSDYRPNVDATIRASVHDCNGRCFGPNP